MTEEAWSDGAFREKWQEQANQIGRFNLAIFGKTGVGKSTLINAVFGEDVAVTGIGKPVTMNNHLYVHRSGFLGVIDTRGLEIGTDTDTLIAELDAHIKLTREKPLAEQVHVAWYCVRATDGRFEDTEADFIRKLHELGLPVIAVLTRVSLRDGEFHPDAVELADKIADLGLPIFGGRPVMVMASEDEHNRIAAHGLKGLIDATFRVAPEGAESALSAAQKVDMGRKNKQAKVAITVAAAAAATVGAIPIPFSDAGLLVPIQLGMMAKVAAIYGVKVETATLAATVATGAAATVGRAAAVGLIKLIPGAGMLIGGTISAAVASTFTVAVGSAWAVVCGELTQGKLKGADGALDNRLILELFQAQMKAWLPKVPTAKE